MARATTAIKERLLAGALPERVRECWASRAASVLKVSLLSPKREPCTAATARLRSVAASRECVTSRISVKADCASIQSRAIWIRLAASLETSRAKFVDRLTTRLPRVQSPFQFVGCSSLMVSLGARSRCDFSTTRSCAKSSGALCLMFRDEVPTMTL